MDKHTHRIERETRHGYTERAWFTGRAKDIPAGWRLSTKCAVARERS